MPTYELLPTALSGYRRLSTEEQAEFKAALRGFIEDLRSWERNWMIGRPRFRAELRVKDVQGRRGVWEMTWQWPNGRATFQYGPPARPGTTHIIWRRIGGHAILRDP